MRWLEVWMTGLLPGVGLGWLLHKIFGGHPSGTCAFVDKKDGEFIRCPAHPSNFCIERLCPTHCASIHKNPSCFAKYNEG